MNNMNNFVVVNDASQLDKIFEVAQNKLVVLMFYTKNNPDCRKAKSSFEKSATNHNLSYFCVVDTDKFEGDSKYLNNLGNMPKIDFYYMGTLFGNITYSNDREIEHAIKLGEHYVMTQSNNKTSSPNNQNQMPGMMNQPQQINPNNVRQQIINTTMMQNPAMAQQLLNNPAMLNNMVQQQIQLLQQQNVMMQQQNSFMPSMPTMPSMQTMPTPGLNMPTNQQMMSLGQQMSLANPSTTLPPNVVPTFQQMQHMFQIFLMMQQMGVLNIPSTNSTTGVGSTNPTTIDTHKVPLNTLNTLNTQAPNQDSLVVTNTEQENIITLPTGEKIISLGNGKFGLIKKS